MESNLSHTRWAGCIEGGLNGDNMSSGDVARGIQFGLKVYGWLEYVTGEVHHC